MKWFIETFLVSLEERYSKNNKLWLTEKQANVCKRYMNYGNLRGQFFLDHNDKKYCIQVAPNGCAKFFILNLKTGFITN